MAKTQATLYLAAVYICICIVGLIGNGAVLCTIARSRRSQAVTNIFIFNLALADLLYALCLPAAVYQMLNGQWTLGGTICKLYYTCDGVSKFASVMFLVVLSFDRYTAVCHPIRCRIIRTAKIAFATTGAAWTIVVLGMIPVFLYATLLEVTETNMTGSDTFQCVIYWAASDASAMGHQIDVENRNVTRMNIDYEMESIDSYSNQSIEMALETDGNRRIFTLYLFILSFLAPLALVWLFYTMILHRLWRQKRRLFKKPDLPSGNHSSTGNQNIDYENESQNCARPRRSTLSRRMTPPMANTANQRRGRCTRRVTIMVLSIVICYTVCWIPYWCVQLTIEFFRDAVQVEFDLEIFTIVSYIAYGMQSVNSMLNPFLYAFGTQIHRRCLLRNSRRMIGLIGCRWRLWSIGSPPPRLASRSTRGTLRIELTGQDTSLLGHRPVTHPGSDCPRNLNRLRPSMSSCDGEYSTILLTTAEADNGQMSTAYFLCCYCEKDEENVEKPKTSIGNRYRKGSGKSIHRNSYFQDEQAALRGDVAKRK